MEILVLTQDNCRYCKLTEQYLDREEVNYDEVNVSEHPEYVGKYNLMGAPTVLLLDGDEEVSRSTGFNSNDLDVMIEQL